MFFQKLFNRVMIVSITPDAGLQDEKVKRKTELIEKHLFLNF